MCGNETDRPRVAEGAMTLLTLSIALAMGAAMLTLLLEALAGDDRLLRAMPAFIVAAILDWRSDMIPKSTNDEKALEILIKLRN